MSALAMLLARRLWAAMLWLMRRKWMRNLQDASVKLLPEHRRDRARANIYRQNRLARRWGLRLLHVALQLLLASIVVTLLLLLILNLSTSGALTPPKATP